MFKKGSKLYSITKHKCPRCHEGDLYKTPLTSMEGIYNMHENCTECEQPFAMEPGFYWGAMYIGYALSSAYMLTGMALAIFALGLTLNQSFALVIFCGLFIVPMIARTARAIWININVRYRGLKNKKIEG